MVAIDWLVPERKQISLSKQTIIIRAALFGSAALMIILFIFRKSFRQLQS